MIPYMGYVAAQNSLIQSSADWCVGNDIVSLIWCICATGLLFYMVVDSLFGKQKFLQISQKISFVTEIVTKNI